MRSERSHRIALLISGTIGLVAFTFVLIEHLKIRSFEKALAEFVKSETNGEYSLVVEKSDINLRTLKFRFENLHIEKTDKSEKGVHVVRVPYVEGGLGSLKSFFNVGQVTIEELSIAEPLIEIDAKVGIQGQFNVAHTLVRIFPAIESILKRFNVQSMRISRGNVRIEKEEKELLHLKLIDFLVHEWDMRQLSSNSRIQLNIQGQQVDLNKSSFTFSEVEFKYPEHFLVFKDFKFETADTSTHSRVAVEGNSVLIEHLDYNELYFNQRFKLKKIEILEPRFTGRLAAKKTRHEGTEHYEHPLTEILKQTFGEVNLDSAIIRNARIDLALALNNDSVKSTLPKADIVLSSLRVMKDSSRLQIGEIYVDLPGTEIKLNDDVKLECSNMSMTANRNFTITNARISTIKTGKEFVNCGRIVMEGFKILYFIFDRRILAQNLELENANVTIASEYFKLFPAFTGGSSQKIETKIQNVTLRNVNVNYTNDTASVYLNGVHAVVNNVREFSGNVSPHQVSMLKLSSVNGTFKKSGLHFRTGSLDLNERYARVNNLNVNLKEFHFSIDHLRAIPSQKSSQEIDLRDWDRVEIGTFQAEGQIPQGQEPGGNFSTTINQFHIGSLTSNVSLNKNNLSFQAKELSGKGLRIDSSIYFHEVLGKIYNLKNSGSDHETYIDSLIINTNGSTSIHQMRYSGKNLSTSVPHAVLHEIDGSTDTKSSARLYASNIQIHQVPDDSLAHIDSLILVGIHLNHDKPVINDIELFNPVIRLERKNSNEQSKLPQGIDFIKNFKIHGAHLTVDDDEITLMGNLTGQWGRENKNLAVDRLRLKNKKSTLTLSNISLTNEKTSVGQLNIEPNPLHYNSITEQTDVITGELREVTLKNLSIDSVIHSKSVVADSIYFDDFSLHIKRDKRLPEPLPFEKPLTIDGLLYKSKVFTNDIRIRNGQLTYEEISAKTGRTGKIELYEIKATINKNEDPEGKFFSLHATANLYDKAPLTVRYRTLGQQSFNLLVLVDTFDLTHLNQMVLPLEALEVKSGHLKNYELYVDANHEFASGEARMTYDDLHLEIFKHNEPEKKSLGSELLTLLADGIILKHDKENAIALVNQPRVPEKSVFNYWVKSVIHGSLNVIRHGKKKRKN